MQVVVLTAKSNVSRNKQIWIKLHSLFYLPFDHDLLYFRIIFAFLFALWQFCRKKLHLSHAQASRCFQWGPRCYYWCYSPFNKIWKEISNCLCSSLDDKLERFWRWTLAGRSMSLPVGFENSKPQAMFRALSASAWRWRCSLSASCSSAMLASCYYVSPP